MWFVDKLGPMPNSPAAKSAANAKTGAPAQQRPAQAPAAQPPRAAAPQPAPEPEKKKKKGWF